jgi:hypothetical protein
MGGTNRDRIGLNACLLPLARCAAQQPCQSIGFGLLPETNLKNSNQRTVSSALPSSHGLLLRETERLSIIPRFKQMVGETTKYEVVGEKSHNTNDPVVQRNSSPIRHQNWAVSGIFRSLGKPEKQGS